MKLIDEETGYFLNDTYGEEFADRFVKHAFNKLLAWGTLIILILAVLYLYI